MIPAYWFVVCAVVCDALKLIVNIDALVADVQRHRRGETRRDRASAERRQHIQHVVVGSAVLKLRRHRDARARLGLTGPASAARPPPPPPPPRPNPPPRPAADGVKLCVSRRLAESVEDAAVLALWKFRLAPGRFGAGMYWSSALDAASMRLAGIWLPGMRRPVHGSINGGSPEKSPARIASRRNRRVLIEQVRSRGSRCR